MIWCFEEIKRKIRGALILIRVFYSFPDTDPLHVQHVFAISVFEDYLYWTDWELKSVLRAHKYTGRDGKKIYTAVHRPMDIHVYHPYRQLPCM